MKKSTKALFAFAFCGAFFIASAATAQQTNQTPTEKNLSKEEVANMKMNDPNNTYDQNTQNNKQSNNTNNNQQQKQPTTVEQKKNEQTGNSEANTPK